MNYNQVVSHFYPNKSYFFKENNYESFEWFEKEEPKPTDEHICYLWKSVKTQFKLNEIRYKRNCDLKLTDYLMVEDYPHKEGMKEKWKAYRQSLRDLPLIWIEGETKYPSKPE